MMSTCTASYCTVNVSAVIAPLIVDSLQRGHGESRPPNALSSSKAGGDLPDVICRRSCFGSTTACPPEADACLPPCICDTGNDMPRRRLAARFTHYTFGHA